MQCVFLMQRGKTCYCEVLADRYGDSQPLPSSWVCRNGWKTLCPYYEDAMDEQSSPVEGMAEEMAILHPSRIGHFNRIHGHDVVLPYQH